MNKVLSTASTKFLFILFAEAVTNGEEVPTSLLVHVPHVRFLTCVFCIWFIDQVHQEEPTRRKIQNVIEKFIKNKLKLITIARNSLQQKKKLFGELKKRVCLHV